MKTETRRVTEPGPFSCRRGRSRLRVNPSRVTCWSKHNRPTDAAIIEADTKGARLIFPWHVEKGDDVTVSFGNQMGLYRTEKARIAWTKELDSGRIIAGLYYVRTTLQAA